METNNFALYIAIGFFCLAIISFGININSNVLISISISTLIFSSAQALESEMVRRSEVTQEQIEAFDKIGNFGLDDANKLLFKYAMKNDESNEKKNMRRGIIILNSLAFIVLFIGFVIPIKLSNRINVFCTIMSVSIMFLSLWIIEKQRLDRDKWEKVYMLSLIMRQQNHVEDNSTD